MQNLLLWVIMLFAAIAQSQWPAGEEILKKIDANLSSHNRILVSKMIVHGRRDSRTFEAKSWVQGIDKAFTEYLAPPREKGTKMLKLGNQLWIYSPTADRIIRISGHMLRQSLMGSDLSYEDMMQDPKLAEHYHAEVQGVEEIDTTPCWVLQLKAKTDDQAYSQRKLWVDQKKNIPLRQELYAKSGKLLKKLELKEVRWINGRWYPMRLLFKDMLKTGQGTEFIIEHISFDEDIPEYIFTKAALKK